MTVNSETTRMFANSVAADDLIVRALAQVWSSDVSVETPTDQSVCGEDRRTAVRRDGNGDVSLATVAMVAPDGTGARCEWFAAHGTAGRLIDLSTTGVSLLFVKPVEINTSILVRLASRDQSHPIDVPAKVVRAVELPHGEWKIVAQFDHPLCFDLAFQLTQNPNA